MEPPFQSTASDGCTYIIMRVRVDSIHTHSHNNTSVIVQCTSLETRPSPSSAIIITLTFEPYRSYGGGRFSQICARDTRHDRHNDALLQLGMF